jgi:hypothetical protein
MIRSNLIRSGLLALAGLAAAAPLPAQSILATRGLGYPMEALDGRARGMGGLTAGAGGFFSMSNPAASAGIPAPAVSVTFQSDWYQSTAEGVEVDGTAPRFPLIAVAFPVTRRLSGSIGYGAFLDQNWAAIVEDSLDLVTGRVPVQDRLSSEGGAARLRAGAAYLLTPRLAVGLSGEVYTGVVRDTLVRTVGTLLPVFFSSTFRYSGVSASGGVRWSPDEALGLSASITAGGTLKVEDEDSVAVVSRDYSLPVTVDAGAVTRIASQLELAASVRWAGWSSANEALAARGGSRDALTVAGGVEYDGLTLLNTPIPLRLGARLNQLPFRWDDGEFADERAVTGGLGFRLGRGTAQVDLGVERGWRGGDAAAFEEPYWRGAVTFSILGR